LTKKSISGSGFDAKRSLDGLTHISEERSFPFGSGFIQHVSRWIVADVVARTCNKDIVALIGGCLKDSVRLAALSNKALGG
jgi:hypothetical protein